MYFLNIKLFMVYNWHILGEKIAKIQSKRMEKIYYANNKQKELQSPYEHQTKIYFKIKLFI